MMLSLRLEQWPIKRRTPMYDFNTSPWFASHGSPPRGRGSWAFSFVRDYHDVLTEVCFTPSMTYGEAKKWITGQAKRCGVPRGTMFFVQP